MIFGWCDSANQQLDEAEYDIKNYADRGGCYSPKPKLGPNSYQQ